MNIVPLDGDKSLYPIAEDEFLFNNKRNNDIEKLSINISLEDINLDETNIIIKTLNKLDLLLNEDNIKNKDFFRDNINDILNKSEIIDKLNEDTFKLVINLPLTINDIPIIISIIIDNIDLINNIKNKSFLIDKNNFKYIIFSLIYYILIQSNSIDLHLIEENYMNHFEINWKIILFDFKLLKKSNLCSSLSSIFKFK